MPRPKPWLKLWREWIHDPKMLELTLAERGVWVSLLTLAQQCAAAGQLVKSDGSPLTLPEIAKALHLDTRNDIYALKSTIKQLEPASLVWDSGTLTVVHFAERQAKQASATKEAVRDRVRLYRSKHVTENPLHPLTTPLLPSINNKDNSIPVVEVEGESVTKSLHCNGETVTPEAILAEIVKYHNQNFTTASPLHYQIFTKFIVNYHSPIEWIKDAFLEAVANDVKRWSYVEAILNRWQKEGRGSSLEYKRQKSRMKGAKTGKAIPKLCPACGYKGLTADTHCPECANKGEEIELGKDYTAGKYGHMVWR